MPIAVAPLKNRLQVEGGYRGKVSLRMNIRELRLPYTFALAALLNLSIATEVAV